MFNEEEMNVRENEINNNDGNIIDENDDDLSLDDGMKIHLVKRQE